MANEEPKPRQNLVEAVIRYVRKHPEGNLPKNSQAWFLVAIAVVMCLVIAFSGRAAPKREKPSPFTPPPNQVVEPNQARIEDYQRRISEAAKRLEAEQAQLAQMHSQAPLAMSGGVPTSGSSVYGGPGSYAPPSPEAERAAAARIERRAREEKALFSSNISLSYRERAPDPQAAASEERRPASFDPERFLRQVQAESQNSTRALPDASNSAALQRIAPVAAPEELTKASGKLYRIFQGTFLDTVLTNRLDGTYSGPVDCLVATDVYSHNGQRLLIPRGSRVLGEVHRVQELGQQRLAVAFSRIIMPDGFSVNLEQSQGLNQLGETGLKDKVNNHYWKAFGASIAIGAISGLTQAGTRYGNDASFGDVYRQNLGSSVAQSSLKILERFLNILPTVTIREGHRIKVYLTDDLLVPAYDRHELPSDL